MSKNKGSPEVCVCAAIRMNKRGLTFYGRRHGDCLARMKEIGYPHKYSEQGFLTSDGRFVDRLEGRRLQDAAGIQSVAEGGYRGNTLFSEDLY
jgi:hypothetical protein